MTRAQRLLGGLGVGVLLLASLLVAQHFGLGDRYRLAVVDPASLEKVRRLPAAHRDFGLKPFASYDALLQRPVFNEDRKPTPIEAETTETPAATVAALDAQLTGVILMPSLRLAMIRENASGKALRVRLGSELDGALAGWKLVELQPRKAIFEAEGQGRQELELAVDKAGAPASAPQPLVDANGSPDAMGRAAPSTTNGNATPGNVPLPGSNSSNAQVQMAQASGEGAQKVEPSAGSAVEPEQPEVAESIRRRIEERRRQLREEAARLMQQQPQQ